MSFRRRRKKKDRRRFRGVYLLPNLITTGSLFAGFYAIVAAMDGRFYAAAWAILIALILDGLDGRIARMTKAPPALGCSTIPWPIWWLLGWPRASWPTSGP